MIWTYFTRIAALLHLAVAAKNFKNMQRRELVEINPNRIYNSYEAATLLGIDRSQLLCLIRDGKIGARLIHDNYRITGLSLMEYLKS
ncbi:MAG: helix-turn-helix domain-containing protein [Gammaproteobacteria bacterium]|nr:helix-turn-helix domain-containing protein [Gammaproteobacteria bacterium]